MIFAELDMMGFVGHFHPLLVHLPIGILLFATVISVLPRSTRESMDQAFSLSLLISAVSSLAACIAGYLLSLSGEYDTGLVEQHQWLGIATCILSFAAYFTIKYRRWILWSTVLVMVVASHFGGTITHGEGYLFSLNPSANENDSSGAEGADPAAGPGKALDSKGVVDPTMQNDKANSAAFNSTDSSAAATRAVYLYRDEIKPILQDKCYACHAAVKKKGGLRLDGENFIKKGGKNGSILTNGNPDKSTLYSHLVLPLEDELHMPPKGKKQLSRTEVALIHRWIRKGAPFGAIFESAALENGNQIQVESPPTPGVSQWTPNRAITSGTGSEPALAASLGAASSTSSAGRGVNTSSPAQSSSAQLATIPAGDVEAIRQLKQQGVVVNPVAGGSHGLSINFVNLKSIAPATLEILNRLSDQVVELKFTNQPLGNNQLQSLAVFPNLKKLQLERTGITDEGISALGRYPNLESLNLYGNAITDKGLQALTLCSKLRKLYLWQTATTNNGMEALKKINRELDIESGSLNLIKPDSTKNK